MIQPYMESVSLSGDRVATIHLHKREIGNPWKVHLLLDMAGMTLRPQI